MRDRTGARDLRGAGTARMRDGAGHAYGPDHRMRLALLPQTDPGDPPRATASCSKHEPRTARDGDVGRRPQPLRAERSRPVSLSRKACYPSDLRAMKRSTTGAPGSPARSRSPPARPSHRKAGLERSNGEVSKDPVFLRGPRVSNPLP